MDRELEDVVQDGLPPGGHHRAHGGEEELADDVLMVGGLRPRRDRRQKGEDLPDQEERVVGRGGVVEVGGLHGVEEPELAEAVAAGPRPTPAPAGARGRASSCRRGRPGRGRASGAPGRGGRRSCRSPSRRSRTTWRSSRSAVSGDRGARGRPAGRGDRWEGERSRRRYWRLAGSSATSAGGGAARGGTTSHAAGPERGRRSGRRAATRPTGRDPPAPLTSSYARARARRQHEQEHQEHATTSPSWPRAPARGGARDRRGGDPRHALGAPVAASPAACSPGRRGIGPLERRQESRARGGAFAGSPSGACSTSRHWRTAARCLADAKALQPGTAPAGSRSGCHGAWSAERRPSVRRHAAVGDSLPRSWAAATTSAICRAGRRGPLRGECCHAVDHARGCGGGARRGAGRARGGCPASRAPRRSRRRSRTRGTMGTPAATSAARSDPPASRAPPPGRPVLACSRAVARGSVEQVARAPAGRATRPARIARPSARPSSQRRPPERRGQQYETKPRPRHRPRDVVQPG